MIVGSTINGPNHRTNPQRIVLIVSGRETTQPVIKFSFAVFPFIGRSSERRCGCFGHFRPLVEVSGRVGLRRWFLASVAEIAEEEGLWFWRRVVPPVGLDGSVQLVMWLFCFCLCVGRCLRPKGREIGRNSEATVVTGRWWRPELARG
ncbi:hypothetical protein HAX54_049958 [Datura stramonium]|uniref:Uncharacterized protein n=1 Tax=Datura stramonium TaxID=4076 RepID=A0ABS8SWF6_DATST|nr:hypothetical protein [Datura stramonium]